VKTEGRAGHLLFFVKHQKKNNANSKKTQNITNLPSGFSLGYFTFGNNNWSFKKETNVIQNTTMLGINTVSE